MSFVFPLGGKFRWEIWEIQRNKVSHTEIKNICGFNRTG